MNKAEVSFPIDAVRVRFPPLNHRAFLEAPGGTQICASAIRHMVAHLRASTANVGATLGSRLMQPQQPRDRSFAAMAASVDCERVLVERMLAGLARISGLRLYGPSTMENRVPTFAFTLAGHDAADVARHLAAREIFAWSGHFYAVEVIRRLALEQQGGLVRVGLCQYSTAEEVDRLIAALEEL